MIPYPIRYLKVFQTLVLCVFPFLLPAQINLSLPVGTPIGGGGVSGSGGSTYSIPINILPGTNGMQPNVTLVYNSQSGDGIAGWGWHLSCMSVISRAGKNNYYNGITAPVKYTNTNDAFVLDGQRMFVLSSTNGANGAVYGLENEQFSKIESFGGSETLGPAWFRVTTKSGLVMEYGNAANTKMTADDGSGSTMMWLLNKITDINGNYQQYIYSINQTDRTYALAEIQYTGNANTATVPYNKVLFTYSVRNDWQSSTIYDAGASLRRSFYLSNISIKNAAAQTVRSYDLNYAQIKNQYFLMAFLEKGSNGTPFNPLLFSYGANNSAANVATSIQYPGMHQGNVYAGDFDGDSRQDVLQSNYYYDNNNIPHYTSYDVLSDFGSFNGQPAISFFYNYKIPQSGATEVRGRRNAYFDFLTYDFDGDTKEDVLMINSLISGSDRIYNGIRINYSRKFSVISGPTYDSASYLSIPRSSAYTQNFRYVYRNGNTFGSFFVPGDFDGDGAQDYILILGINNSNAFKGFFSSPKKGIFNQEIAQFGVEGTVSDPFYANSIANANQLIPIDFDGDGKREILVVKDNQSYVLSVFPVSATTGYNYAAQVLYTVTGIKSNYPVFPGDFNGDGKTDLLYRNTTNTTTGSWFQLTSTGKAYHSQAFNFFNRPYLTSDDGGNAHHLMVADLNGDGKTDVWHSLDLSGSSSRHTIYYSNGLSFLIESYEQGVSINGSKQANTVLGDFNGDSKPDMLTVNSSSYGRFIYPKPFKEERLLTKVVNGLGAEEGFNYSLTNTGGIYNRSAAYEYDTRGVAIGTGANGNPYNVLSTPMYVVGQSYRSNGISSGLNYTAYQYTDAAFHRIKGFLGFKKVSSTDGATGIQSVTESNIHSDFLALYPVRQHSSLFTDVLSDTRITSNFIKPSTSYFDKRYVYQITKSLTSNGITGAAAESSNTYDNYGNITQNITKTGSLSGETVTAAETSTTTTTFGIHGTPYPAAPENVTVRNTRSGQVEASKVTTYGYNTLGLLTTKVEFAGKPKAVTTTYAYDGFGNVKQTDVAATGVTTRTTKFTYDNTGRFLMQMEALGSGISKKEIYTYETLFGNPATRRSADGLTTSYQYDVFGRVVTTTVPEGYNITQSLAWESTYGRYSLNVTRPGGGSNVKTYYDILGREVRKEISGFNNGTLISSRTYNNKGQESSSIAPHYSSEATVTSSMQYDNFGRVTQVSNGTITNNYTYNKLSGGQYRVTVTNGAGQSSSKTQDAAGRTVTAADNGGSLSYTYNSQGNPTEVAVNGTVMNSSTFDDYGNQLTLTDKNAGTYSYQYDALGQLTSQTTPSGQATSFAYDPLGRLVNRNGPEGATTYEYWKEISTGYCNDNVVKVTGFAGETKDYTYDNLRRPQTEKITVDGSPYTTQYAYDSYSNPVKVIYPSGVVISRTFDRNGTVTAVKMGEGTGGSSLFTATGMNSLGRYTTYSYGNGKSTTETYNLALGALAQTVTTGIQQLNFTYDPQTGNLTSRKDMIRNLEEVFTYDNLNRLKTTKVNNVQQLVVNYDGGAGSSFGNITSKTDAGNYVYNNQKINAVAYVTNPAGAQVPPAVISQQQQDITYTPYYKTATVTEGVNQLTYTYGSDYQRVKSVLKQNGAITETKYYLGDYEKQVKGSVTRELHYVGAGNGLGAIIVKEGSAINVYYTYTDYLGSILAVTNASGTVVASQNFDAWGRYRNPANWTYASVPNPPDWLYRGFTGHEHMKEFVLVNMNGRMYDPVLGRMMSPDNYVALPWNTQGYNRYGYALNNPLVITDPDGEVIHILIGAVVGGVVNLAVKAIQGKIHNFGDGLAAFGIGAAAGAIGAATGGAALGAFGLSAATIGGGALAGAVGAAAASPVQGVGNHFYFGDPYSIKNWATDVAVGGVAGGVIGGIVGKVRGAGNPSTSTGATGSTGKTGVEIGDLTAQMPDYVTPNGQVISGNRYVTSLAEGGTTTIEFGTKSGNQLLLGAGRFPRLDFKFGKHVAEWSQWGEISKNAYYSRAVGLAESPVSGNIMGFTSKQGWIFKFNSATGEFLTIHPSGYIETFFRPQGGMEYYLKQVLLYGQ